MLLKFSSGAAVLALTLALLGCNRTPSPPVERKPGTPVAQAPAHSPPGAGTKEASTPRGPVAPPAPAATPDDPVCVEPASTVSEESQTPEEILEAEIVRLIRELDSAEVAPDQPPAAAPRFLEIGEPAVSALVEAAQNGGWKQRCGAMVILAQMSADARQQALPAIVANLALPHEDAQIAAQVRAASVHALGVSGLHGAPAIPRLITLLHEEDTAVAAAAAEALGKIGLRDPAVEAELSELLLRASDESLLCAALEALGRLGVSAETDPEPMIGLLQSSSERVRRDAAWLLGEFDVQNPALERVVAALLDAFSDEQGRVREQAYGSLGQLGRMHPQVAQNLIPLLESDSRDLRYRAAFTLSLIGPNAQVAVPTLLELIENEQDDETHLEAINALREIDPQAARGLSTPPEGDE